MIFPNQTQQKTFFIATGIVCAVLQVGFAPHLHILNGHPNFALIFAGCAMATLPPVPSLLCGFFAGVFFDLVGAGPFGLMAFCLSVMNFLCGLDTAKRMGESWKETYRLFCLCALGVEFVALLGSAIAGDIHTPQALVTSFLPAVFWDVLLAIPFFYILGRLTPTASSAQGSVGASKYADSNYSLDAEKGASKSAHFLDGATSVAQKGMGFSRKKVSWHIGASGGFLGRRKGKGEGIGKGKGASQAVPLQGSMHTKGGSTPGALRGKRSYKPAYKTQTQHSRYAGKKQKQRYTRKHGGTSGGLGGA